MGRERRAVCAGCEKRTAIAESLVEPGQRAYHFGCLVEKQSLEQAGEAKKPKAQSKRGRRVEASRQRNRSRGFSDQTMATAKGRAQTEGKER